MKLLDLPSDLLCHTLTWLNVWSHVQLGASSSFTRNLLKTSSAWITVAHQRLCFAPKSNMLTPSTQYFLYERRRFHQLLPSLKPLAKCPQLRTVHVAGLDYGADLYPLACCPVLEEVYISGCDVEDLSSLGACPNLRRLTLRGWGVHELSRLHCLSRLSQLKHLYLGPCPALEDISFLSKLPNLQHLELYGLKRLEHIDPLQHGLRLKKLVLHGSCPLLSFPSLSPLRRCVSLQVIHVDIMIHACDMWIFSNFRQLASLQLENSKNITNLNALASCTKLTRLAMKNTGHTDMGGLHCPFLKTLSLINCTMTQLPSCPRLTSLHISGCASLTTAKGLETYPYLETFELHHGRALTQVNALEHCHRLQSFCMFYCLNVTSVKVFTNQLRRMVIEHAPALQLLRGTGSCQELEDIRFCSVQTGPNAYFWRRCRSLRRLTLEKVATFTDADVLAECRSLRELNVTGVSNAPTNLQALAHMPCLETLTLNDLPMRRITALASCVQLRNLRVWRCTRLEHLNELQYCTRLQTLCVLNCHQFRGLRFLPYLRDLEMLNLQNVPRLDCVDRVVDCSNIVSFTLTNCPKVRNVMPLAHCQQLKHLKMYNTGAPDDQIVHLKQLLHPLCDFDLYL